jgi:hypothetical protein
MCVEVAVPAKQHEVVDVQAKVGVVGPSLDVVDVQAGSRSAELAHARGASADESA